jgi:isopenicillin N synthase-like dioxygenase
MKSEISIVDFEGYLNGDEATKTHVAKQLLAALKSCGFVYLENFGITPTEVEQMFAMSKKFFDSSFDLKQSVKKSHTSFCGYDKLEFEKLSKDRPADYKESYMIKQTETPWPQLSDSADQQFKQTMLSFHKKCLNLSLSILHAILLSLDIADPTLFDDKFKSEQNTILRLLHYPPMPQPRPDNQLRCAEHTDYGAVSFLFQDSVGGLEIKTLQNKWLPAPPIQNTILVNLGDCIEMWTHGFLRASPHRVVNTDLIEKKRLARYSTAFFFFAGHEL